jgi:hypothetical protein
MEFTSNNDDNEADYFLEPGFDMLGSEIPDVSSTDTTFKYEDSTEVFDEDSRSSEEIEAKTGKALNRPCRNKAKVLLKVNSMIRGTMLKIILLINITD